MKTMNDYFNELRVSMKGATPEEARAGLIQRVNADWAAQCRKVWNPDITKEVLDFMNTASTNYGVKEFRITDPNVAHECMRDDLNCVDWIDAKLLTPEYVETLLERDKHIIRKIFMRAQTEPEFMNSLLTPEYVIKQLDQDVDLFELLPECYRSDLKLIERYLPQMRNPASSISEQFWEAHPERAVALMSDGTHYWGFSEKIKSMDVVVRGMLELRPNEFSSAPNEVKGNEEYALLAIKNLSTNINVIPKDLMRNRSFAKEAIKINQNVFKRLSKKDKFDFDYCMSLLKDGIIDINNIDDDLVNADMLYNLYKKNPQLAYEVLDKKRESLLEYAKEIGDNNLAFILETKMKNDEARMIKLNNIVKEHNENEDKSVNIWAKRDAALAEQRKEKQAENEYLESVTGIPNIKKGYDISLDEEEYDEIER